MKNLFVLTIILLFFSCKQTQVKQKLDKSKPEVVQKIKKDTIKNKIKEIENKIESNSFDGFKKQIIDIDNDEDLDLIYLYQCGEVKCVELYLNINNEYKKAIDESCYEYVIKETNNKNLMTIKQNHCCGESPFTSVRSFSFNTDKIKLNENYVIFNDSKELLSPKKILQTQYKVRIINVDYNIRFSPNIREYNEDESAFSCEESTNIIGKLNKGAVVNVLSEIKKEERIWLFVEIKGLDLNTKSCNNPINYNFKNQKLRAWISGNFTEKADE